MKLNDKILIGICCRASSEPALAEPAVHYCRVIYAAGDNR
jgi:hypothetical protein